MNVRELIQKLHEYPGDLQVLYCMCSDYEWLRVDDLAVVKGVRKPNGYVMRSHATMSAENKSAEESFLLFPGN